jgi:hypothetical protein
MKTETTKPKKSGRFIFWAPRIVAIIFILFLALFSLDVFGNGYGFWQTVGAFLMHNIPSFILTAILIIAWRYEIVGAVAFWLAGLVYIGSMVFRPDFQWYQISWSFIIAGPAIFIGILFWIGWRRKKIAKTTMLTSKTKAPKTTKKKPSKTA